MLDKIVIKGAREHNLKNINLEIPRNKFVVVTGLSGSGKSSLAFDTIYAEGQRRYVESLSSYARQFLGQMEKPDVDSIEGLSPAISIDQKTTSHNPRSTVGTVTEIYDYLRLLYARIGHVNCYVCGNPVSKQTVTQIVDRIMNLEVGSKLHLLAPLVRGRKGEYTKLFDELHREGYVRVRIDGEIFELSALPKLEKNIKHNIEVVVDRLIVKDGIESRLADSLEVCLKLSDGLVFVWVNEDQELLFSEKFSCPTCNISMEELAPRSFSFNNPYGACPECSGLGYKIEVSKELVIPDPRISISDGAIAPWNNAASNYIPQLLLALSLHYKFSLDKPFSSLPPKIQSIILYGSGDTKIRFTYKSLTGATHNWQHRFEGIIPMIERRYRESHSDGAKKDMEEYMTSQPCPACKGARLRPEVLSVYVGLKNISQLTNLTITEACKFFENLQLTERELLIARLILVEIKARLGFLLDVGLSYLTLSRTAGTLSGGESQRIRLATQIGSRLIGVLYILDEPSIGLHQRDNNKLIKTLMGLRDLGNTLLVVEHDEDTMLAADYLIDIGPRAGIHGGEVVAAGSVEEIMNTQQSITGQYLSGAKKIPVPEIRRKGNGNFLKLYGANINNLQDVDIKIPLGSFNCITGVSGSGKSSLINEVLYKILARDLNRAKTRPGAHKRIEGLDFLDKVIDIDQSPIGRTPRSNPATYTGVFDEIRSTYASTNEAKIRGYKPGRFSFNVKGGRCEICKGDGIIKIEMHFLPDIYVPCEECRGARYNRETLQVHYKNKTIDDVLKMTIEEAVLFFENIPRIHRKLKTMQDVGLGYIKLGQSATTLSGGEAQRVKLATELSKRATGKTIYILDEPTTGLHTEDVRQLLDVLHRLVDNGETVVVIEHNLDVIKTADYIIDLGPEGGIGGGRVIACGTPEEIVQCPASFTGEYLRGKLRK